MRAITICQPYASLIATGQKRVENRSWPTRYRGAIAVHAGKSRQWLGSWDGPMPEPMPFGAVIAKVNLIACLPIDEISRGLHDQQFPWLREHEHTEGPWCWVLENVLQLPEPVPASGAQGIWLWSEGRSAP